MHFWVILSLKLSALFQFILFVLKDLVMLHSKCFLLDYRLELRDLKSSHCESTIASVDLHVYLLVFAFLW